MDLMPPSVSPASTRPRAPRTAPLAPWPAFDDASARIAADVLRSGRVNYWTGGEGKAFEAEWAAYVGAPYGIALANGSVALEDALVALGIGPGDEVVVPPRTFVATATSVLLVGATPVFCDVDEDSGTLTAETLEAVLTPRTRAVIAVHLGGWPAPMPEIVALARRHGLFVVEDGAQAHGARIDGQHVGTFGDVGAWSFCQDKILTTAGEGGALTTADEALWRRMWSLKDHGKDVDRVFHTVHPPGFRWLHAHAGSNHRMSEIHAAVGRWALGHLDDWHARRTRHATYLMDVLGALPALRVPVPPPGVEHGFYKLHVYVRPERLRGGWDRDRIAAAIGARGVPCFTGSCSEVYLEDVFVRAGVGPAARLPVARRLGETSLQFLVHPTLSDGDLSEVAAVASDVVAEASL